MFRQLPARSAASGPSRSRNVIGLPPARAHVPAVISSLDLGVFAVTAAGPGLRRGHVICSDVFAVTAVAAAGVSTSGPLRLAGRGPLGVSRLAGGQLPSAPGRCQAGDGSGRAGRPSVPGDGCRPRRPDPPWAGALRWPEGTAAAGSCVEASWPVRSASAGTLRWRTRPPDRDDTGNAPSCGGDMSTPQKRPSTRHYLLTTSDNRRSGRLRG